MFYLVSTTSCTTSAHLQAECGSSFSIASDQVLDSNKNSLLFAFSSRGWIDPVLSASPCVSAAPTLWLSWQTCSTMFISFSYWGSQNWALVRPHLEHRVNYRSRVTCLDLLATLSLIQSRRWLAALAARAHCCLLSSTKIHRSFSAELLPKHSPPPACSVAAWGYSIPEAGLSNSPSSCQPISWACQGLSE